MHTAETQQKFVERRAQGWSLVRIATELGVAKSTLVEWSRKFRFEINNQRALELSQTSYRVGKSDLRAVQQQQLSVHAARLALLRVQSEQLAQRVNLHLALGGSFETRPVPKATTELKQATGLLDQP